VKQTYFRYEQSMSSSTLRHQVLLGTALGLIQPGAWDGILSAHAKFPHARIRADSSYQGSVALSMFFADLAQMTPRSQESLEAIGRKVLASLIAPDDQSAKARLDVLGNDTV
jgi:hypothetical protein